MGEQEFLDLCKDELGGTRYSMTKDMTMAEWVVRIGESAQRIARKMLESRLEEDPRRDPEEPLCGKCGWRLRIQDSVQRRVLRTGLGKIE